MHIYFSKLLKLDIYKYFFKAFEALVNCQCLFVCLFPSFPMIP